MAEIIKEKKKSNGKRVWFKCDNCGKKTSRSKSRFSRSNKHYCSRKCSDKTRKGSNHPKWKNGINYRKGYKEIHKSKIEEKYRKMANKIGYIKFHRYIKAKDLGRPLSKKELVHHKNGNKKDNRLENLQIMTASEHIKNHEQGFSYGEKSPNSKLKAKEVKEIKRLLKDTNLTNEEISKFYWVHPDTIYNINVGKTWRHIE